MQKVVWFTVLFFSPGCSVDFLKITFFWKARRLTQHLTGLVLRITLCGIKLLILVIARLHHENICRKKIREKITHLELLCNLLKIKIYYIYYISVFIWGHLGSTWNPIISKSKIYFCYDIWYGIFLMYGTLVTLRGTK